MTIWQSILQELAWSMPPDEQARLSGSTLTVTNGDAVIMVANEDAGRWLAAHYTFVIRRRLLANAIPCERVLIDF